MILSHGLIRLLVVAVRCGDFYGELGANHLAIAAGETGGFIIDRWKEIPFGVQFVAHFQDAPGTELNTVAAALAPFPVDRYLTRSGGYLRTIKRLSPQLRNHLLAV